MSNWINHVKQYASQKGITYTNALKDQECKSSYHSKKTVTPSVPKEIVSVPKEIILNDKPKRRTKKTIINIKPIDENKINIITDIIPQDDIKVRRRGRKVLQ